MRVLRHAAPCSKGADLLGCKWPAHPYMPSPLRCSGCLSPTIKVNTKTRDALQALKGKHSYDELLEMFLKLVPEGDDESAFKPEFRLSLLEGVLYDGPRISHAQMRREFGLK